MWILWGAAASAATWTVGPGQSFATIGDAIAGAGSGDEIVVDPGVWAESLDLSGKDLEIRSVSGPAVTTIAPPSGQTAARWDAAEDGVLEGFTIETVDATAFVIEGGAPTLRDLDIVGGGQTSLNGGAIYVLGGAPTFEDVSIDGSVAMRGGGIYAGGSAVLTLSGVEIRGTEATWGGAVYLVDATVTGVGLTIDQSEADYSGAGLYLDASVVDVVDLWITDAVGDVTWGVGAYLRAGSELVVVGGEIGGCEAASYALGYDGGAVWLDATSRVDLRDFAVHDNRAFDGAGISSDGGDVVLDGVSFDDNTAGHHGGAIAATTSAAVDCTACTFTNNAAEYGGAVRVASSARLTDVQGVYTSNTATQDGGAVHADGAGSVTLTSSVLQGNEAGGAGGAVYATGVSSGVTIDDATLDSNVAVGSDGGALWTGSSTSVVIQNSTLERNRADAGDGGALAARPATGTVDIDILWSRLVSNVAGGHGGAIMADGVDDVVVEDSSFLRNTAASDGGAMQLKDVRAPRVERTLWHLNNAGARGGAVVEDGTTGGSSWWSCTFTENVATRGGGLSLFQAAQGEVTNATFAGNRATLEGGHVHVEGGTVRLINVIAALGADGGGIWGDATAAAGSDRFFDLVWQNAGGDWAGSFLEPPLDSGNVEADPMFRNYTIDGDETDDDLRLAIGSPAIDAGDPSLFDVDGSSSDIGAWGGPEGWRIDDDLDGVYAHADCDDTDPERFPGNLEVAYDGIDQDCSGEDETDLDDDGYDGGLLGTDCDDSDPEVNPGMVEVWYDGVDADCLGDSDYDADLDGYDHSGYGGDDCDDTDATVSPGVPEVWYDGFDQDCSGGSDYDRDGDGRDADGWGGDDCDDGDESIHPGADEVCDRRDNDCDGEVDEDALDPVTWWVDDDGDGYGDPGRWALACFAGGGLADNGTDCDDSNPQVHPGAFETWYDGVDQDCDGRDDDQDLDGWLEADDCDDLRPEAHPGAPELRNSLDDDCDGWPEDADRDQDGLIDWDEWALGTDPLDPDCDDDSLLDGEEVPHPEISAPDHDRDGLVDPLDDDDDGDFIPTRTEVTVDADGDGRPDRDIDRDGLPNHLDANTDGDDWDDATEGLDDRDNDGVPDFADYQGALTGGGCSGGQASTVLFLLPLFLRRRRSIVLAALLPATALAQVEDGLDAHSFDVYATEADPRSGLRLAQGRQGEKGAVVGVVADQANRPLEEQLPGGADPLVRFLTTANVVVSATPMERLRFEAVMPVHLLGAGTAGTFTTTGDWRVGAAVGLLPRQGLRPGLSVVASTWIPTGAEGRYVGHPTVAGGGMFALSQRFDRVGWTLDVGARLSPTRAVRGEPVGPGPLGGMGVHWAPSDKATLLAELAVEGTTGLGPLPLESSAGVRMRGDKGRWWTATAGAGLTDAPGIPAWRVTIGGGFGPKVKPTTLYVMAPQPEKVDKPKAVKVTKTEPVLAELVNDRIVLYEQVFFKEARADLARKSIDVMQAVKGVLEDHPEIDYLLIEGHTNHNGSRAYNYKLSDERARAVAAWLVAHGIARQRLITEGYGYDRPLLDPGEPDADTVNRRVEFVVVRSDEGASDRRLPTTHPEFD